MDRTQSNRCRTGIGLGIAGRQVARQEGIGAGGIQTGRSKDIAGDKISIGLTADCFDQVPQDDVIRIGGIPGSPRVEIQGKFNQAVDQAARCCAHPSEVFVILKMSVLGNAGGVQQQVLGGDALPGFRAIRQVDANGLLEYRSVVVLGFALRPGR